MKTYEELKAEMEALEGKMLEAKKHERAEALKEVRNLCKTYGFTHGMLKNYLSEGRPRKPKQ